MAYRDDLVAAHERIADLEAEITSVRKPRPVRLGLAMHVFICTLVAASLPVLAIAVWIVCATTK